jgi:hypothetical protein
MSRTTWTVLAPTPSGWKTVHHGTRFADAWPEYTEGRRLQRNGRDVRKPAPSTQLPLEGIA